LDKKEIELYLNSDEPRQALQESFKEIRSHGINGVPAFIIDGKLIFGAQPYKVFEEVIKKALDENS